MSDKFVFSCFCLCFACLCVVLKHFTQMYVSQIYALGLVKASCFLVFTLMEMHSLVEMLLCVCVCVCCSIRACVSQMCTEKPSCGEESSASA